MKKLLIAILILTMCLPFAACDRNVTKPAEPVSEEDLWSTAKFRTNTEMGIGGKTLTVDVTAGDKTITLTIITDAETVGEALKQYKLIEGEEGAYGLYVKKVNGITADYDVDKYYWAFTKNGESVPTGVDGTQFKDGDKFEFIRTKD